MSKSFFSHFIFILTVVIFSLAGCGKRGDPSSPEGADEIFPAVYPPADE